MADLIPAPDLELRTEDLLAAQLIARTSGGWTRPLAERYVRVFQEMLRMIEEGTLPADAPVCPELTNANPSSPHTVLLEEMARLVAFIARRLNYVPEQTKREFHRLFRIELREAAPATATLRFTSNQPSGQAAIVPAGTEARTAGGEYAFTTDAELIIPAGAQAGDVSATRTATGRTVLAPHTVTQLIDPIAYVTAVTNPLAVDSGADRETIDSALERARSYQRRGERIVTARDLEDALLHDVLLGNGIVRAFDFVKDGDWSRPFAGHVTVVAMTRTGAPVGDEVKARMRAYMAQQVGSIFTYLRDPEFVDFDVAADVRLKTFASQGAALAAARRDLIAAYKLDPGSFGRTILRSEIIAIIEGAEGVERIAPQPGGAILASPAADVAVQPFQMPRLREVTINVVP